MSDVTTSAVALVALQLFADVTSTRHALVALDMHLYHMTRALAMAIVDVY